MSDDLMPRGAGGARGFGEDTRGQIGQDVRILRWKDGKNDAFGKIVETIGSDCFKVQLYDDMPHLVNEFKVFHESWLKETRHAEEIHG